MSSDIYDLSKGIYYHVKGNFSDSINLILTTYKTKYKGLFDIKLDNFSARKLEMRAKSTYDLNIIIENYYNNITYHIHQCNRLFYDFFEKYTNTLYDKVISEEYNEKERKERCEIINSFWETRSGHKFKSMNSSTRSHHLISCNKCKNKRLNLTGMYKLVITDDELIRGKLELRKNEIKNYIPQEIMEKYNSMITLHKDVINEIFLHKDQIKKSVETVHRVGTGEIIEIEGYSISTDDLLKYLKKNDL